MLFNKLKSEQGVATLVALIIMGMLLLIGLAAVNTSEDEVTIAGNELQEMRAFYAAEAGLESAAAVMNIEFDSTGKPPAVMPTGSTDINGCEVAYATYDTANGGVAEQRQLSSGTLAGLHALVKPYTLKATAVSVVDNAKVSLAQNFESALVPIFQFAVFYGNDLEVAPGPSMNLIGRVHSNGDMYVQANNDLQMDSYVTAAGSIYHGRKGAGSVGSGDVQIKDASGTYVSMKQGSGYMDADYGDWYDSSVARWNGRVQDEAHGQGQLNVPLNGSGDPHKLVEPATGNPDSYELKSGLKIIDGVAWRKNAGGSWIDVTAAMTADGALTYSSDQFYDGREGEWVDVTELDIDAMYANGYEPINGVVYFSDEISGGSDWPAIRLVNGSDIQDAQGLSVASANPLYTLGDFNSTNKKPCALLADAVTFLSNAWASGGYDAKSTMSKGNRLAAVTTVNASYLTGNIETTASDYNGGFENLPRFLEKWTGKNFNWTGSAVNLWYSQQANSNWGGTYYSPPVRNWQYDTDLDDPTKLPPESPVVRIFQRTGWVQQYVGTIQ